MKYTFFIYFLVCCSFCNAQIQQHINEINSLFSKYNKDISLNVSKEGTLSQGEKMFFEIIIIHTRTLPFNTSDVEYKIIGEYYNING